MTLKRPEKIAEEILEIDENFEKMQDPKKNSGIILKKMISSKKLREKFKKNSVA